MKPRFVIVMLVVIALAVPVSMPAQQNSKAEKEIRAVLEELRTAPMKDSAEGVRIVDKYYADELVRIPGDGRFLLKLRRWRATKLGTSRLNRSTFRTLKSASMEKRRW
jgi:hypothetical protein